MDYTNIIQNLKCEDIPDTRKLQEIRLNSVGKVSIDEEFMKKHYKKEYEIPRTFLMNEEDMKEVYSSAIPLTFPMLDPFGYGHECETRFFRWESSDCQKGAMHLTTSKNLEKLITLFSKYNIEMKTEEAFGEVSDFNSLKKGKVYEGISVPHSWQVDNYDPYQGLFKHQFVALDESLFASPYYYLKEEISFLQEQDKYKNSKISIENNKKENLEFHCWATFHLNSDPNPQIYLPELLQKYENNLKLNHQNWRSSQKNKENSHSLELKLLKIGEPIEIYNPAWINH